MKNIFLTTYISTTYTPAREHPLKHACLRKSLLYLGDETRVFQGGLSPYKMLVFTYVKGFDFFSFNCSRPTKCLYLLAVFSA